MAYKIEQLWLWLELHGEAVYASALKLKKDPLWAEEIFEEVFLQLIREKPAFSDAAAEAEWFRAEPRRSMKRILRPPLPRKPLEFEALKEETYQLMQGAEAHGDTPAPKRSKKWLYPAIGGAALAAILCAVLLPLALSGGDSYEDPIGTLPPVNEPIQTPAPTPDPAPAEDPLAPALIQTEQLQSFASLQAFSDALADKSAKGYGKNYYNTRALLLLPSALPDQARFRQLTLQIESGNYEYSYAIERGKTTYLLQAAAVQQLPQSLTALEQRLRAPQEESKILKKSADCYRWQFGSDILNVSVSAAKGKGDPKEMKEILEAFIPARSGSSALMNLEYAY